MQGACAMLLESSYEPAFLPILASSQLGRPSAVANAVVNKCTNDIFVRLLSFSANFTSGSLTRQDGDVVAPALD